MSKSSEKPTCESQPRQTSCTHKQKKWRKIPFKQLACLLMTLKDWCLEHQPLTAFRKQSAKLLVVQTEGHRYSSPSPPLLPSGSLQHLRLHGQERERAVTAVNLTRSPSTPCLLKEKPTPMVASWTEASESACRYNGMCTSCSLHQSQAQWHTHSCTKHCVTFQASTFLCCCCSAR